MKPNVKVNCQSLNAASSFFFTFQMFMLNLGSQTANSSDEAKHEGELSILNAASSYFLISKCSSFYIQNAIPMIHGGVFLLLLHLGRASHFI
jgi:hypothetical protein